MRKMTVLAGLITSLALVLLLDRHSIPAGEPATSPIKLKLMAINRTVTQYKLWEEWAQAVEKRANGRVKFDFTSLPELGLGGAETIRVTKTGVVDIAEFYLGYVAGELPMVEMLEIPGVFPHQEAMQRAFQAWRPHLARLIDEKVNGVLLATAFQTDQFLFSKRAVRTMDDFKGMKIRVHSVAIAQLVAGLGGDPLTIAFAEVYTALERGTLDAGITGTKPGYGLRWYEVAKYLVGPISMRPHDALSINKRTWNRLPKDIQAFIRMAEKNGVDFAVLKEADLVHAEKAGKSVIYHLKLSVLEEALLGFVHSFGAGSGAHICGLYFQDKIGTRMQFVFYRGGAPAMQDLVAGQIDLMCAEASQTLAHVRGGKIKAFVTMSNTRYPALPDVPTTLEAGLPDSDYTFWMGLFVPARTSPEIVTRLRTETEKALKNPNVVASCGCGSSFRIADEDPSCGA